MNLKIKEKNILWKLTFPFAHNNYTIIGDTLYYPKGYYPGRKIMEHELVHVEQRKAVGSLKFYFLYLFALPFLYNPYRYKWEMEAYKKGQKYSTGYIKRLLRSKAYGWLRGKYE